MRFQSRRTETPAQPDDSISKERIVWNKLRARHYSILILLVIVTLETSAIAIDRFLTKNEDYAFQIEGKFRNNSYIERFQLAEARSAMAPAHLPKITPTVIISQSSGVSSGNRQQASTRNSESVNKASAPAQIPTKPQLPDKWIEYSIKKGDSLAAVSSLFGLNSDTLRKTNNLKDDSSIKAGQKIIVPVTTSKMIYTVKEGDSLTKIASRFGVTIQELVKTNNLKNHDLMEDQKLSIPIREKMENLQVVKNEDNKSQALLKNLSIVTTIGSTTKPEKNLTIVKALTPEMVNPQGIKPELKIIPTESTIKTNSEDKVQDSQVKSDAKPVSANPQNTLVVEKSTKESVKATNIVNVKPVAKESVITTDAVITKPATDDEIKIVVHTVKSGDNIGGLARMYKTSISQIVANNQLSSANLKVGQQVKVPVNKRYYRVLQVTSKRADVSTKLNIPVRGRLTDSYGWRLHPVWRRRLFHAGVDISAPRGTPISAAMSGTIVYAGWLQGYGKLVVIRHPNGLSTRYGHCSSLRVKKGQAVRSGQIIGGVGATGTATGNHLHFEIRRNGKTINPSPMMYGK